MKSAKEDIKMSLEQILQALDLYNNAEDIREVVTRVVQDIQADLLRVDGKRTTR